MRSIKIGAIAILALTLMTNTALAWGSRPDEPRDKLNTIIEKNQDDAVNKSLDSMTEQAQEETIKAGGKQS